MTEPATTTLPGNKSGQRRTILTILAGVVLVGLLGGLAGVVFDGDHAKKRPTPGPVSPTDPALLSTAPAPAAVPSSSPLLTYTALEAGKKKQQGHYVTLDEDVRVWVPPGWTVKWSDESQVNLCSSELTCVYAFVDTAEPSIEATEVVLRSLEYILNQSPYTQREIFDVVPLQPVGSIVSFAMVDYTVMYVDNQGSTPLYGRHSVLVRQDGVVLVDDVRSVGGPDQFNAELESWAEVLSVTQTEFAGGVDDD
jgi:hypothetical protein